MSSVGFSGKLTDIHAASHHPKHRTTLGHFLQHSPWEDSFLLRQMKQQIHRKLSKNKPAFLIIDDTISKKTKASSRAMSPTEACGFHFSHTEGKSVFGHQVVQLMTANEEQAYPYDFRLYHKEEAVSKIDFHNKTQKWDAEVSGETEHLYKVHAINKRKNHRLKIRI